MLSQTASKTLRTPCAATKPKPISAHSHQQHVHSAEGGHHHPHGAHHHHGPLGANTSRTYVRRLVFVFCLVLVYAVAEAIGGWFTGSLALLADATHMVSDVAALGIALGAIWLARRPATPRQTYGFHRAEVLGALINATALIVIAVFIAVEAYQRLAEPNEVLGGTMLLIALGGLAVNLTGVIVLHSGQQDSLNVRGVWLHMMADTLGSVGAILSGFAIWKFGFMKADPIASFAIAALVLWSSLSLLRETLHVLMESTPKRLDAEEVRAAISAVPGVASLHDLHIWTITSGHEALTAHLVADESGISDSLRLAVQRTLREKFELHHVTLQIEHDEVCESGCDGDL